MAGEERTATTGNSRVTQGRGRNIAYRLGLALEMLGAAVLAVLYPLESPFYTVGIMLFELGALLAALSLFVRSAWLKGLVLAAVLAGIPLQAAGVLFAPPEHAVTVILSGIGLVALGAAGMAAKEAYCFGWREGWGLAGLLPAVALANLFGMVDTVFNALGFSLLFLLLLSLTGRKLRQPLSLGSSSEDRC
jgi:uncharacterized integral membrane protein